jgi:hypothetical protein
MATNERISDEVVQRWADDQSPCVRWGNQPHVNDLAEVMIQRNDLAREVLALRAERPHPPARGEEAVCECGDALASSTVCWVCIDQLRATLTATEARLAEAEKRADAAVAIAREAVGLASGAWARNRDFTDIRAQLAALSGEG